MLKKVFKLAGIFVLVGLILGIVGVVALGKDRILTIVHDMSNDSEYVAESYESNTGPAKLDLQFVNRNIVIIRDDVINIEISYYQSEKDQIECREENGTLIVTNDVRWQFFTFFNYVSSEKRMVEVTIPNTVEYDIKIMTTNGNIVLEDLDTLQTVDVATTNGTIKLMNTDVTGNVELRASNGTIQVTKVQASQLLADTINGEVIIREVISAAIDAESTNGSLDVSLVTCDDIDLNTSNGVIDVEIVGTFEDYKIVLHTVNGKIRYDDLTLSSGTIHPDASKVLSAQTVNGGINFSFTE